MSKQIWGYIKQVLIILLLFVASAYFSFLYDDGFRRMIRFLYVYLSHDRIEIRLPKKYFHFAGGGLVLAFAFYTVLLYISLRKKELKKILLFLSLSLIIFFISIVVACYIDGLILLAECTACLDGKRVIRFNEIPYDRIFVQSLIISALPVIVVMIKTVAKNRMNKVA